MLWDFLQKHWRDGVEIFILAALAYHGYLFFRATRGARILTGLVVLLQRLSVFLAIGLVIIFQPELRRVLAELGSQRLFSFNRPDDESLDTLVEAMEELGHKRVGALIAIKRSIDMKHFAESGVEIDGLISRELLGNLFYPKTPLHDGGVIVDQGRIFAAGCVFPVSQREVRNRAVGLRHRAAMGVTEETDAVALIVSEETGALSLAFNGRLYHDLESTELRDKLMQILTNGSIHDDDAPKEDAREAAA
jgi:diadenylate cyclase